MENFLEEGRWFGGEEYLLSKQKGLSSNLPHPGENKNLSMAVHACDPSIGEQRQESWELTGRPA